MITPAHAFTATERVLPRLALDFTTGVLDPRVAVTRALNTATRVNSSGLIETVNADLPRFDYDPITLATKGLLIEETRANLLLHSSGVNEIAWTKDAAGTGVVPIVVPNFAIAPDGTMTADRIQFNRGAGTTVSDFSRIFQFIGGGDTRTATVYLKSNDANTYSIQLLTGSNVQTISVTPSAFTRFSVSGANGSNFMLRLVGSVGASTTADILFWGAQLETGAFATSYIPTTTTSLTRNADGVSMTGADFSGFWQAGKGSALIRARPSTVSGIRPLIQFDDATADNIIALCGNAANPELYVRTGGVDQAQIDAGTIAANTRYRLAGAWAENSCAASLNSGTPVLDGVATIPTVTQARLGSDGINYLNGHIEAIEYYDERIPNSALQVVSSTAGYQSIIGSVFRDAIIS